MVTIRPYSTGDDLKLAELLHDPATPAQHAARAMFRADSDGAAGEGPALRCVVAILDDAAGTDMPVGAAAIMSSPLHPERAWVHVEVAAEERGHGVGAGLLDAVIQAVSGTELAGLPLRTRVEAGSEALGVAEAQGFAPLFTTRVVQIEPMALGNLGADRIDEFEVVATGSVVLTQAFANWYTGVNRADPTARLSLGRVNNAFLSEAAGAHGAALLHRGGQVSAFAVSYAQPADEQNEAGEAAAGLAGQSGPDAVAGQGGVGEAAAGAAEPATELTVGVELDGRDAVLELPHDDPDFQAALQDAGVIIARLSTDVPVVIEVTDEMPVLTELTDGLLAAGQAGLLYEYVTLGQ